MKKAVCAVLVFSLFLISAGALDLEASGGFGNIAFDGDRESPPEPDTFFEPNYYPLGRIALLGEMGPNVFYNGGFERDPVLKNTAFINAGLRVGRLTIEGGPFVGVFNSSGEIFNPGISFSVGFDLPPALFLRLEGLSSLGNVLERNGAYVQKKIEASAGFWIPNAICSFNYGSKNYFSRENSSLFIEDALEKYFFRVEVYIKNVPFTLKADFGYKELRRYYISEVFTGPEPGRITESAELRAGFLALEGTWTVSRRLKALFGGELPLFSWSNGDTKGASPSTALFEAHAGIIWTLPEARR